MPTSPMRRVRTIVTGVAGSPYYLVGYFDAQEGTAADCVLAWSNFCLPTPADGLEGSVWETQGVTEIVDPVSGNVTGIDSTATIFKTGDTEYQTLPPSNQCLIRWRTGNYVAGREVRGRTNLPLQSKDSADTDGKVAGFVANAYTTRAQLLVDNADITHVVWSKKNGVWWATESGSCWTEFSILRTRRD